MISQPRSIIVPLLAGMLCCSGCRVPVIDRGANIVDGVPALGTDVCCPPEQHPGAGCKFGKCDFDRYGPRPLHGDPLADKVTSWHRGPDCTGYWTVVERLIGRRRVHHCLPGIGWLGLQCGCKPGDYAPPRTPHEEQMTIANAWCFFALSKSATVDGLRIRNEDIIAYNGREIARVFDGSDVGLGKLEIDAFDFLDPHHILISFSEDFTVDEDHALPGIYGQVEDSDILVFSATSLGEITRGTFAMFVDGSDVGLETDDEDIDALAVLPDGRLIVSTVGNVDAGGVSAKDEDLLVFQPSMLGVDTQGDWSIYLDGSKMQLATKSTEDVDAVGMDHQGRVYLSTRGAFDVGSTRGGGASIFVFLPQNVGDKTQGEFEQDLFFDGQMIRLKDNDIAAFALSHGTVAN